MRAAWSQRKWRHQPATPAPAADDAAPHTPGGRLRLALAVLAVAATVLVVYWPVLHTGALSFDDDFYLTSNPLVRYPSWHAFKRFVTEVLEPSTVKGYYQPLTMITLMLDYAAGGRPDHLLPFHRTSLILHAVNVCLVILLLHALFGRIGPAAAIGLLFGLHPMTVEVVAWVSERKTLLAACFALLSLNAYVRYARTGSRSMYGLCTAGYVLSLLAKPTGIALPLCMLLLDYWPLRRLWPARRDPEPQSAGERPARRPAATSAGPPPSRSSGPQRGVSLTRAVWEKSPLLAITLLSAWITYESQRRTASVVNPGDIDDPLRIPYIISHNIIFYLHKIAWPANLTSHYPFPDPLNLSQPAVLVGVIGTLLLVPALILSLRWTRALLTGWLFFFLAIFPTLGVIGFTNVIASDKYTYLPSVGLMLPLAYFLGQLTSSPDARSVRRRQAAAGAGVAVLALLAALATRAYLVQWRTTESLYRHMLENAPQAANLYVDLGVDLARQGRPDEALELYETAVRLLPGYTTAHFNIASILMERGDLEGAIARFRFALRGDPGLAEAHNSIGSALLQLGRIDEAERSYRAAIDIEPAHPNARYNLANVLVARGLFEEAIAQYRQVLDLQPNHAAAHKNLGSTLLQTGNAAGAVHHYRLALRYRPDDWPLLNTLVWILATHGDPALRSPAEAVTLAERAAAMTDRREPATLAALAVAYSAAGRTAQAAATAREAVDLALALGQPELADEIRRQTQLHFQP